MTVYGVIADRPAVIKGIRVDVPTRQTQAGHESATQPRRPRSPQPPIIGRVFRQYPAGIEVDAAGGQVSCGAAD